MRIRSEFSRRPHLLTIRSKVSKVLNYQVVAWSALAGVSCWCNVDLSILMLMVSAHVFGEMCEMCVWRSSALNGTPSFGVV
jgi:hypothetical protein